MTPLAANQNPRGTGSLAANRVTSGASVLVAFATLTLLFSIGPIIGHRAEAAAQAIVGAEAMNSGQSLVPSVFDTWLAGSFTIVETRSSAGKTSAVTRVRTEVTARTHDTLDFTVTTDLTTTIDISGRQVVTESHTVVESSMNFSTHSATTSTTSTIDGVTAGPFDAEGPIEVHKLVQIPGLARLAKPTRTERVMKRGVPIECDVYEIEGKDGKASAHLSKSIPLGGPLGGLLKSSSPFHETVLIDFATGKEERPADKKPSY